MIYSNTDTLFSAGTDVYLLAFRKDFSKSVRILTMSKLLRLVSPSKVAKTLNTANNVSRGFKVAQNELIIV